MAWAVGRSPANQIVSVPLAHALATEKICFGLWPGLVLELPKSLAVTRIFFFMVYDGNYFNCSTLAHEILFWSKMFFMQLVEKYFFTLLWQFCFINK
jgi:hypothetical protein